MFLFLFPAIVVALKVSSWILLDFWISCLMIVKTSNSLSWLRINPNFWNILIFCFLNSWGYIKIGNDSQKILWNWRSVEDCNSFGYRIRGCYNYGQSLKPPFFLFHSSKRYYQCVMYCISVGPLAAVAVVALYPSK